jgi:Tol biopolymer transport system component
VNPDGTDAVDLTPAIVGEAAWPAWSPDGSQVAFGMYSDPGHEGIWVMNADGSSMRQLTDDGGLSPAWSPDGTRIVYSVYTGLVTMFADGHHRQVIMRKIGVAGAEFSPDGSTIAYSDGNSIWEVQRTGRNPHRVTSGGYGDTSPSWSPDGTRIAFGRVWPAPARTTSGTCGS